MFLDAFVNSVLQDLHPLQVPFEGANALRRSAAKVALGLHPADRPVVPVIGIMTDGTFRRLEVGLPARVVQILDGFEGRAFALTAAGAGLVLFLGSNGE